MSQGLTVNGIPIGDSKIQGPANYKNLSTDGMPPTMWISYLPPGGYFWVTFKTTNSAEARVLTKGIYG